ncbi:urotensin-2 receptor-like [Hemicordylus capensis]|uniref:urotensin-2 receptor-like n=1 Tax=Hemicordylus capensis TaxID=884348 RepID=UPI002303CD7E|nr:urotensin-2 receptor-like [Hemicordylus capensis]XP_053132619.1 urotensin-2 receptor-like [Hemicordylus capensis]
MQGRCSANELWPCLDWVQSADIMERDQCTLPPCQLKNSSSLANITAEVLSSASDGLVTSFLGCFLAAMCLIGMVGNIYTLVIVNLSVRLTGSMYVYIVNLALADLLYLSTIPFVVCTYFVKDWYFGDVGCRVLFSLDLLTMHASIFILTVMSTERYRAVVKPLDTIRRPRDYRRAVVCAIWLVSFLLALPTMILIDLQTSNQGGVVKRMCRPTWQMEGYKIYLTVLFGTSILAPGVVVCSLYVKLVRTYWRSQVSTFGPGDTKQRCPRQKVLYMIFCIILTYWICFIPFWLWQLLSVYHRQPSNLKSHTVVCINFLVTCLAYSNSCINPFLYTLLSKNYKEYLKSQPRNGLSLSKIKPRRGSSRRSVLSGSHVHTESVAIAQMEGINDEDIFVL